MTNCSGGEAWALAAASVLAAACASRQPSSTPEEPPDQGAFAVPGARLYVGVKSRAGEWDTERNEEFFLSGESSFGDNTLAERETDAGFLLGPETMFAHRRLWLRGFYLTGTHDAPTGDEQRDNLGFDVGLGARYGEVFVGYRHLDTDFEVEDGLVVDHDVGDPVLGVRLHTAREAGLNLAWELALGLSGLASAFSFEDQAFAEQELVAESELVASLGLRHLWLYVGAGVWYYYDPLLKEPSSGLSDTRIESLEFSGYGVSLGLGYRR